MRKHRNTYIYMLRGSLGGVALVPAAGHNLAHRCTDTGLEEFHVSRFDRRGDVDDSYGGTFLPISQTPGASLLLMPL